MRKQEMKIKNYRAASLREALVQVKQELGEEALVVETRKVRAGGILGFGARNMVEVRVLPNPGSGKGKAIQSRENQSHASERTEARPRERRGKVNLREATPATPVSKRAEADAVSSPTFAALAARTYGNHKPAGRMEEARETGSDSENDLVRLVRAAAESHAATPRENRTRKPVDAVELAETAPRIVHSTPGHPASRSGASGKPGSADSASPAKEQPGMPRNAVSAELTRLRAELREVKFALSAFAARPGMLAGYGAPLDRENDLALAGTPNHETYLALISTGLQPAMVREAIRGIIPPGAVAMQDPKVGAREVLMQALPSWVRFAETPVAVQSAIAFVGPTGVGKTTTIAKLAARIALRARKRVELITLDTYRIAAVQQLKTYAEIIGAGFHVARSLVELDALTRRFTGKATVLIDTTGRSPHDLADQMEPADYLRGNQMLMKCLVLPATLNLADAQIALDKFALYGANRLVLTKLDETVQPGVAVSVAAQAGMPLVYLCAGQRVPEDLERATPKSFAARIVRNNAFEEALLCSTLSNPRPQSGRGLDKVEL
jgi:flagellar biosynthesis protein FlhF